MKNNFEEIYDLLYDYYGPQSWWPGEGLEIAIGAILTQQANWSNVEKALSNLKKAQCLTIECLKRIELEKLEDLIYPSGFYKLKAKRIKNLVDLFITNPKPNRNELLAINGLGHETVDSILLYWFKEPFFVIDSYTFRIFARMGYYSKKNYLELQSIFMENLPKDVQLYNEYHALIVKHAKYHCVKTNPKCNNCPLQTICKYFKNKEIEE